MLSVLIVLLGLAVSSHATLVDMHDGTIYDTDTQLSWLQNANTPGTEMSWEDAVPWAASLNNGGGFAGLTGWRLPITAQPDTSCSASLDPGHGYPLQYHSYGCSNSEMGHLYYTELGNPPQGPATNTGPFTNYQTFGYWSGTSYEPDEGYAWYFNMWDGFQWNNSIAYNNFYATAVRPGARTVGSGGATPVGYNFPWLVVTLISLTIAGGLILRRRMARQ